MTWDSLYDQLDRIYRGCEIADQEVARAWRKVVDSAKVGRQGLTSSAGVWLPLLSQEELLRWAEAATSGAATAYDKSMDAVFNASHEGGNLHRIFDGLHDIPGSWAAAQQALPDDSLFEEISGWVTALMKDASTQRGVPLTTLDPQSYSEWVERLTVIPGVDRDWLADGVSWDTLELLGAGMGTVACLLALNADEEKELGEMLGAMGITALWYANPLGALAVLCIVGYSYYQTRRLPDGRAAARGATVGLVSALLFQVLGLPLLIELVIVLVVARVLRNKLSGPEDLLQRVRRSYERRRSQLPPEFAQSLADALPPLLAAPS
jgi:hypothetical protein